MVYEYVAVWFIMTNGAGYIPPQDVRPADMKCGLEGAKVGVTVDRPVNPTRAYWPDPKTPGQHCEVDISQRVAGLAHGEYHIATTEFGPTLTFGTPVPSHIGIDPHTTEPWLRSLTSPGLPPRPANFKVGAQ